MQLDDTCFDSFPTLETERLVLRRITPDDAADLFHIFSDDQVMKYWSSVRFERHEEAVDLVRRLEAAYDERRGVEWGISVKGESRLVGKCCFHRLQREHFRAEIGYALARDAWGRGLVREALGRMLAFGFEGIGLHSVEAQIDPGNAASIKVVRALGFEQEGHIRENFYVGGRFTDTLVFSLLRRAWEERGAEGTSGARAGR